jgi:hypothetical protein
MPSSRRRTNDRPYRPSREEMSKLMGGDAPGTSTAEGLTYSRPGQAPAAPRKTGRQLADEAIARTAEIKAKDPRWQELDRARREKGREEIGYVVEAHVARVDEAILEDDEALLLARLRDFAQASPAGFNAWLEQQDEFYLQQRDDLGFDPDDFDESELPSYALGNEVARSVEMERLSGEIARTSASISEIEKASGAAYRSRLRAEGIEPDVDDESSIAYYENLTHWIGLSTGVHPGELVKDGKGDKAAEMVVAGHRQLEKFERDNRIQAEKKRLLGEDLSLAAGLTTGADKTNALLREQNDLLRMQNGLDPDGAVPVPAFDPEFQVEPTREQVEDPPETIAEFKASLREEEKTSLQSPEAFTSGGEPVPYNEVARNTYGQE